MMQGFHVYDGKGDNCGIEKYQHLSKSSQVVAKLHVELPGHVKHKVFFGSRFSSYDLLLYLKTKGILCVRIICVNRLQGCPLESSKTLSKAGRRTVDYRCDKNSRRFVVEWVDNSVVQLASDFVGIEVVESIVRWCRKDKTRKEIPCPQIILEYSKSMRRVDLVNMFLALYHIPCKMKKWYQKIF